MPRVMDETEIDPVADEVEATMTAEEERAAMSRFAPPRDSVPDLTDGGMVGGAKLKPTLNGVPQERGRAAARRAWLWNGTETVLPLAWDTDGKSHDGARRYLLKRFCLCCHFAGFKFGRKLRGCPQCIKSNCRDCGAGTDPKKIIPCYYLRKEDVPFPAKFYGPVNCFLESCPRRDGRGFKTEPDMRLHARTRHRMEYQAHLETQAALVRTGGADTSALEAQITTLQRQVASLAAASTRRRRAGDKKANPTTQ